MAGRRQLIRILLLAACGVGLFVGLGSWQLERRSWKLRLIEQVGRHLAADPVPAPGPPAWRSLSGDDAYLRVRSCGDYLNDRETLVQAVTERGAGFWVLTPLRTDRGFTVLVNRGFVPPERAAPNARAEAQVQQGCVVGLLRLSEPRGGFLRANRPADDRWYSRDVAAIAAARGLTAAGAAGPAAVAPYFIDADATPNAGGYPVGGLTVVQFRNAHLQYALTWFALAALVVLGAAVAARNEATGPDTRTRPRGSPAR